jgi:hypothetical protein
MALLEDVPYLLAVRLLLVFDRDWGRTMLSAEDGVTSDEGSIVDLAADIAAPPRAASGKHR